MISRRTSSIPKDVFPRLVYSDSTCSQVLPAAPEGRYISQVNTGRRMDAMRVTTCRLGNGKRVNIHQRARRSVRAIRAVRNTWVFLINTRVVADVDLSFRVYLYTRTITASKIPHSWPPRSPPNSHNHGLNVHLQTCLITSSKCISKLAWSRPPSASPNSLDFSLQVYVQTRSISASRCISNLARLHLPCSHDHGLQLHLQTWLITASKCMSKLAWVQPPNSLDHGVRVHL